MPAIRIKPGWRKIKGLPGYHRAPKPRPPSKRMVKKELTKALVCAIAHGLELRQPKGGADKNRR